MKLQVNSKEVKKGDTFFAIKGNTHDGHDYINEAIKNGAIKVIAEHGLYSVETVIVENTKECLKECLERCYYKYISDLKLIGVTGTNGKTTTCYLIYQALNKVGKKCAYIGTIGFYLDKKIKDLNNTTPDILDIYKMLIECKDKGYECVVMEVSSQALSMNRLDTIYFDYAIFTNLTKEHLDYHKTMRNYALAKQLLFKKLKPNGLSIINIDDEYYSYFLDENSLTYGFEESDYKIDNYELFIDKTIFNLNDELIETKLIGKYNIYNLTACIIILKQLKLYNKDIIKELNPPVGRVEKIEYKNNLIIIDYAHTPDAVLKIITNVRKTNPNKIYTIIGCGGNRDKSKREVMGKISTEMSDYVIFTNDNPRFEKPDDIIKDMLTNVCKDNYKVIKNRKKAIKKGIQMLNENDILLLLGKGHEEYQIIKNKRKYFSDKNTVLKYIRR